MTTSLDPCRGFRFPAKVIEHAVWLYHCLSLSQRKVELILAARRIAVSYKSTREWGLRFGRLIRALVQGQAAGFDSGRVWKTPGLQVAFHT